MNLNLKEDTWAEVPLQIIAPFEPEVFIGIDFSYYETKNILTAYSQLTSFPILKFITQYTIT